MLQPGGLRAPVGEYGFAAAFEPEMPPRVRMRATLGPPLVPPTVEASVRVEEDATCPPAR